MEDLIERSKVIEALEKISYPHWFEFGEYISEDPMEIKIIDSNKARKLIEELPPAQPEDDMVDDLISFIEREKSKENRTLADWIVQWILEDIITGKCKITGSATDHNKKKMYVEFSFYQEKT